MGISMGRMCSANIAKYFEDYDFLEEDEKPFLHQQVAVADLNHYFVKKRQFYASFLKLIKIF